MVYGTSAATPSFAGIMALVNQQTGSRQGLANPVLYHLAAAQNWADCNSSNIPNLPPASCIFHDVTIGTNAVPGESEYNTSSQAYPATVGYDLATGLGSVNAAALVNAWSGGSGDDTPLPTPSPFRVSPTFGSGATQAFSFTVSNAGGAANIAQIHMLISGNGTGNQACYLIYEASTNGLYLTSDDGAALLGPVTPGGNGSLSNSQCSVAASSVSVSPSGNTVTIAETSSFKNAFAGIKTTMMYTFNAASVGSGWSYVGTWAVPGTPPPPPFAVSPAVGSGSAQQFVYTFTDVGGASNIWQSHMLVTGNGTGNQACYLMYQASNNALYLVSDGGVSFTGPVTPGSSGTLGNSQCSVAASSVTVRPSGNTLTITETSEFTASFAGIKTNLMYKYDVSNLGTGWSDAGTWIVTIPATGPGKHSNSR